MTTLLILTTGLTDVQLVIDGVRHELDRRRGAELHDELERRTGDWKIIDPPLHKTGTTIDTLPEGTVWLSTPKLDALLRAEAPTAALLFETHRDARSAPGDPRFAGAVLEARLLERGVHSVQRCAFLQGTERLEIRAYPKDAIIRREIVERMEAAVRKALHAFNPTRVAIATTGGFPGIGPLVEWIVRLHFDGTIQAYEVPDGAKQHPPAADRAEAITAVRDPVLSFQARRRVLDLVEKGNVLGAWAIAQPLHEGQEYQDERAWTQVVEWLRCFASSLPMPAACNIPVLHHSRQAVRTALRVELALRAGDIPRAVHGTVAFFEAAMWDHLGEKTSPDPSPAARRFWFKAPPPSSLVRTSRKNQDDRPFEERPIGSGWYVIHDRLHRTIVKDYLHLADLARLGEALSDRSTGSSIRDLRNNVAHSEPKTELMEVARTRMQDSGLWSRNDTFLSQPLILDVLRELGETDPANLLSHLLTEVRARLIAPQRRADPG